ncbi:MAG: polysaccharide lyase 6 family protein [Cyclobacteriaceae bacterium]|nr:polysaccharide lyase 6 family protein [Cyclobacteriaceae bacterium]
MIKQNPIGNRTLYAVLALIIFTFSCGQQRNSVVKNLDELNAAVAIAKPGDKIVMANGVWENVELLFEAHGTEENPIELVAEKEGEVILSGLSNLRIAGEYLSISGLVFKNGYTPTGEVISFRKDKNALSNHVTVKNCVIDNYSNPERFISDIWVSIYGKNNTFEHNSLIDKRNSGVTLAVRLDTEESRENHHRIINNYFGPRQNLGSNGGETIRIGTSHYSLSNSNTLVENNYFDRCNGEHEIISNKSGSNIYKSNVFYECVGTLTMRHGKYTLVENNYFLGNGKVNTGGIRVINEYQTVKNNYLTGLTGYRFRGALVVMNGVPNSPINRYNQVVDSKIENNILIDCDYIQLCAGSDQERSAVPIGTTMTGNVFMSKTNLDPFTIYDDISGITFKNNFINKDAKLSIPTGFEAIDYSVNTNENGLKVPNKEILEKIGFQSVKLPVTRDDVGAPYYPKPDKEITFGSGKTIQVTAGENTILDALQDAEDGDVLLLQNGGEYLLTKDLKLTAMVTLKSEIGAKAIIKSTRSTFFQIENGGSLELVNVKLDGTESPDEAGIQVISTTKYAMNKNYKLFIRDCEVVDMNVNHSYNFLKIYQHTMADSILVENTTFKNMTGYVFTLDREIEDLGIYNVETLYINNCKFENIEGAITNIYRGGTDESTFGPIVTIANTEILNSGKGNRNKTGASMLFHGVQNLNIHDVVMDNAAPINLYLTNGDPITVLKDIKLKNTSPIISNNNQFVQENITVVK